MTKFDVPSVKELEFLENLEYIYGNSCSPATFPLQIFVIFLKFKPS